MLVCLTGKLWRQSLAITRSVVLTLIVREQLALGTDFGMNLWILNECMILEMMKVVIDWISHLAKQLTLLMNDESFAPILSLNMIDWIEP